MPVTLPVQLPEDGHVHSQFSWDARASGDLRATCERAVALGLPSLAFTEHVDPGPWTVLSGAVPEGYAGSYAPAAAGSAGHGRFLGAPLDVAAYFDELDRCRAAFPELRILSGVELTEPHLFPDALPGLMAAAGRSADDLDRVIGSVHSLVDRSALPEEGSRVEVGDAHRQRTAVGVVVAYLAEVEALAASSEPFAVLGHIDYSLRGWPTAAGPVPWAELEEPVRTALRALAASGRALEVNTRLPLDARVLAWWHDVGGEAITFGSDAHSPDALAHGFADATAMAEAHGFRPGPTPFELWGRA